MKKKILHTYILMFGMMYSVHAQTDHLFLQQTNNRSLVNPATVGKGGDITAVAAVRQQWIGFPGPSTQALYVNGFVHDIRSGFGLSWVNDKFGPQRSNNIKLKYAHFVPFEDVAFFSMGLGMGVMNNVHDESDFFARDPNDEVLTMSVTSKIIPDFDFGFEFDTRYVEIGAAATHITYGYNDNNLLRPMRNFYVYSRVKVPIDPYWDFIPGITWHNTRKLNTYEFNAAFRYNNNICVNLIYRNPASCGIALGLNITGGFRVAYSYDYGLDNLSAYNDGSHELTISYTVPSLTNYVKTKLRFFRWKMF